jgi:hypothetical protein
MKQSDSLAGRQTLFSLWAGRITSAGAAAVLALIAASGARADVVEKFNLSGNLNSIFGSPTAFTGTMDVDFSSDFGSYAVQSVEISGTGGLFSPKAHPWTLPHRPTQLSTRPTTPMICSR